MSILGNTILDHRGKPCQGFPLRAAFADTIMGSPLPADVAQSIRAEIRASPSRLHVLTVHFKYGNVISIVLLSVILTLIALSTRSTPRLLTLLVTASLVWTIAKVVFGLLRVATPEEAVAPFLARRRCPSCAYDLSETPPDPDGCTTCPECGAAWRIPA